MEFHIAVSLIEMLVFGDKGGSPVPLAYFDIHTHRIVVQWGNKHHLQGRVLRPGYFNTTAELGDELPYFVDPDTV